MSLSERVKTIGAIICPLAIMFTAQSAMIAGGGDTATSPSPAPNSLSPTNTQPENLTIPQVNQQYGGISQQFNGYSGSSLPNCSSSCTYLNLRVLPNTGNTAQTFEGTIGVIFQHNQLESSTSGFIKSSADLNKYRTEQDTIDNLSKQLADALENSKFDRARIIAINLAPKLGYSDYRIYLQKITGGTFVNP